VDTYHLVFNWVVYNDLLEIYLTQVGTDVEDRLALIILLELVGITSPILSKKIDKLLPILVKQGTIHH
jgi:hypothetical protein